MSKKNVLIFLAVFALMGVLSHAQTTRGTITGTVTDESGAVVQGARITVTEVDRGYSSSAMTNSEGIYVVPNLFPGPYLVEAEFEGFQHVVVGPIKLSVAERLTTDIALKVGAITQTIEVSSQGELIQTDASAIGQVVTKRQVEDLPLNGRNFLTLGLLSPGTVTKPQQAEGAGQGRGTIGVSGGRVTGNQFSIDGVYNGSTAFNNLNVALSVDAVEEFSIQRNAFTAEFGYGTGQVNVASKSGSNNFHGSLYYFVRNDVFDARQFFDVGAPPPFRQNQFGASIGGPIVKNKTHFFVNYEGFRRRRAVTLLGTLPSAKLLSGDFSGLPPVIDPLTKEPFPGNQIPQDRFSALTQRVIPFLPQLPTGGPQNYVTARPTAADWDQFTVRIDHQLTEKDRLFGRYTVYPRLDGFNPGLIDGGGATTTNAPQNATLNWTRSFSNTLLNEARAGFNREYFEQLQDGANGPDILQRQNGWDNPVMNGLPNMQIAGFTPFGTGATSPQLRGINVYQYSDNLTWIRGKHTFKFGGGYRAAQQPHVPALLTRGIFIFQPFGTGNPVANFLLGNPFISLGGAIAPVAYMTFRSADFYVHDDWKVTPQLTINIGMRYERTGIADDRYRENGRLGVFDERTGEIVTGAAVETQGLYNPDNLGFQPRFGFAWRPFNENHTVIRGGYGVYNDVKAVNERNFSLGSEIMWNQIVDPFPLFGLPPTVKWDNLWPAVSPGGGPGFLTDDPFARDPYVQMWSLGVQRQLTSSTVLEVTYAGQVGRKLNARLNINQAPLPDSPGVPPLAQRVPYAGFGEILMSKTQNVSNYNALQVRLERRYSNNLGLIGSYTWSKSLDNASSTCDTGGCNGFQDNSNLRAEYGPSSFHQGQRLVVSPMWTLPIGNGQQYLNSLHPVADAFLGGWQFTGIFTFASGNPFPVATTLNDRTQTGGSLSKQFANCVGNGQLPSGQRTPQRDFNTDAFAAPPIGTFGNCGRNILTGRGTLLFDLSLLKDFALTETAKIQFRAEFFNAFNHTEFLLPSRDFTRQDFGRINGVGPAREIQFALKIVY